MCECAVGAGRCAFRSAGAGSCSRHGRRFLGLGAQPPAFTWGLMIAEAKNQLFFRPWLIAIPAAALVALIFAINLIGDAVRDVTAPEGRA